AMTLPLGLNATVKTAPESPLNGLPISVCLRTFHTRTVPSRPPETSLVPLGLNAMEKIGRPSPYNGRPICFPVVTFHRWIEPPAYDAARIRPDGSNATWLIRPAV